MSDSCEFDVVVVGAGFGGLTCALTAAERGLRTVVLERSELIGGASAYSGGQVWVPANHVAARSGVDDTVEAGLAYVVATGAEAPELRNDALAEEWLTFARVAAAHLERVGGFSWELISDYPDYYFPEAPGSLGHGRYLTSAPSLAAALGDGAARLRRSPHFPSGPTYAELLGWGGMARRREWDADLIAARRAAGVLMFGEGIAAQAYRAAGERAVEIRFGHRVIELVRDRRGVTGAVADTPAGSTSFSGSVVLACSTFDWNPELVSRFFGALPGELGSLAPIVLTGDAITLAETAGAAIDAFPRHLAPMLPGYVTGATSEDDPGYRTCFEHCLPHAIIVDESGRRFCDDSFYRAITTAVLAGSGAPRRFFLLWDEQHHRRYGLGATPPGGSYPPQVKSGRTPEEVALALGVERARLERTVAEFNVGARAGEDPAFGRGTNVAVRRFRGDPDHAPSPLLGPLEEPPFFGMELRLVGTGIGMAGAATGPRGRVLDPEAGAIPGLYAIGPAAAPRHAGASYNSGYTLSRSMTYGYLAALDIAAARASRTRRRQ